MGTTYSSHSVYEDVEEEVVSLSNQIFFNFHRIPYHSDRCSSPPTTKQHEFPGRLLKALQVFNAEICVEHLGPEHVHILKMFSCYTELACSL